jgi:hypothetical protein
MPTVVQRPAQRYVAERATVGIPDFPRIADRLPPLAATLAAHGVALAGAPFFRYRAIDMSAELVVEAGIPLVAPIAVDPPLFVDVLPAGRYATLTHVGHPEELMGATAALLDWAQRRGLRWDMTPTPEGEVWGARLEVLLTNPAEEPDLHKWETALLFRLADQP